MDKSKIRYYPHELNTRVHAVKLYRSGVGVQFVIRRYHISARSLLRWNKRFDGTRESLIDKSHRPHTAHPTSHTDEEIKWIRDYMRRNPDITLCELYGKLKREKGYTRNAGSLYRVLRRLGYVKKSDRIPKKRKNKFYQTPVQLGLKWQMDVKYVPKECYTGDMPDKFYQYTVIDESSRQRFIYAYKEQSSYSTCDFLKRAVRFFGYRPQVLQTDNGAEFTHISKTDRVHPLDALCEELNIVHKRIRPRTPQHNGKVERSHRNDQERFYSFLKFYSFEDLQKQMKAYRDRSNNIPMQILGWNTANEMRKELESFSKWMQAKLAPAS